MSKREPAQKFILSSLTGAVNQTITLAANAEPRPPPGVECTFDNMQGKVRGRGQKVTLKDIPPDPNTLIDLRKHAEPALSGAFTNQHSGCFRGGDEVLIDDKFVVHKKLGVRVKRTDVMRAEAQITDAAREMRPYTNATHVLFNEPRDGRLQFMEQLCETREHFDEAVNDANFKALEEVAEILNKYPHVLCHIHCDLGVPREALASEQKAFHVENYYKQVAARRVQACIDELKYTHNVKTRFCTLSAVQTPDSNTCRY